MDNKMGGYYLDSENDKFDLFSFLADEISKETYLKFKKQEIPYIKVILQTGGEFIYWNLEDFKDGIKIIIDLLGTDGFVKLREVGDFEKENNDIISRLMDNMD